MVTSDGVRIDSYIYETCVKKEKRLEISEIIASLQFFAQAYNELVAKYNRLLTIDPTLSELEKTNKILRRENRNMKKIDIFDILPPETHAAIDKLGYDFLKSHNYKTTGVAKSYKRRARLKEAMKKRGEELGCCSAIDPEQNIILLWFELYRGEERIARSSNIKIVMKRGEDNGEGRKDS